MLPRPRRLARSKDIQRVVHRGHSLTTPYVRVYFEPAAASSSSRCAFVVGKKVDKRAVRRHRYQRWLRAAAQEVLPQLSSAYDMVWVGQSSLQQVPDFKTLQASLSHLAATINNLK